MDPNQQPTPTQPGAMPPPPATNNGGFYGAPSPQAAPTARPAPNPYAQSAAPLSASQPPTPLPQQPGYGPQPAPTFAVDYLDQIAPPPPKAKFFSGSFGKIFIVMMVLLVVGVGIMVANGGQKRTADLENIALRLDNLQKVAKATNKSLKNGKLLATNSNYQIWIAGADTQAYKLLTEAAVKKTDMSKTVKADESAKADELTAKFEDARLNANLDRVYAREMAYQAQLLITMYNKMSKASQAKAIRDYAKDMSANLTPIQKSFATFDDSI